MRRLMLLVVLTCIKSCAQRLPPARLGAVRRLQHALGQGWARHL